MTRPTTASATTATARAGAGGYATRIDRGIARIERSNDRVRQLEAEVERLNARLRDLERDNDRDPPPLPPYLGMYYQDDYYDYRYPHFGNLYYSPIFYYVPVCKPAGHHHGHHHRGHAHRGHVGSGLSVRGSFHRGNLSGQFQIGGGARVSARAMAGAVRGRR